MSALLEHVTEIRRPADVALEIARMNQRLARESTIPPDLVQAVYDLAAGVASETEITKWEVIDPHVALIIHRAVIQAENAVRSAQDAAARDRLRVALESLRQGFAAIAEGTEVADERTAKQIVTWLVETAEVPQSRLADLLGVKLRKFQRWVSPTQPTQPEGDDARRVRAVARIINQLRFSLTPAGAVEWFRWSRDDLGGKAPIDLLDEPERLPELTAIAASMRSTHAA